MTPPERLPVRPLISSPQRLPVTPPARITTVPTAQTSTLPPYGGDNDGDFSPPYVRVRRRQSSGALVPGQEIAQEETIAPQVERRVRRGGRRATVGAELAELRLRMSDTDVIVDASGHMRQVTKFSLWSYLLRHGLVVFPPFVRTGRPVMPMLDYDSFLQDRDLVDRAYRMPNTQLLRHVVDNTFSLFPSDNDWTFPMPRIISNAGDERIGNYLVFKGNKMKIHTHPRLRPRSSKSFTAAAAYAYGVANFGWPTEFLWGYWRHEYNVQETANARLGDRAPVLLSQPTYGTKPRLPMSTLSSLLLWSYTLRIIEIERASQGAPADTISNPHLSAYHLQEKRWPLRIDVPRGRAGEQIPAKIVGIEDLAQPRQRPRTPVRRRRRRRTPSPPRLPVTPPPQQPITNQTGQFALSPTRQSIEESGLPGFNLDNFVFDLDDQYSNGLDGLDEPVNPYWFTQTPSSVGGPAITNTSLSQSTSITFSPTFGSSSVASSHFQPQPSISSPLQLQPSMLSPFQLQQSTSSQLFQTHSQFPPITSSQFPPSTSLQFPTSPLSQFPPSPLSQFPPSPLSQFPTITSAQLPAITSSELLPTITSLDLLPLRTSSQFPTSTSSQLFTPSTSSQPFPTSTSSQFPTSTSSQLFTPSTLSQPFSSSFSLHAPLTQSHPIHAPMSLIHLPANNGLTRDEMQRELTRLLSEQKEQFERQFDELRAERDHETQMLQQQQQDQVHALTHEQETNAMERQAELEFLEHRLVQQERRERREHVNMSRMAVKQRLVTRDIFNRTARRVYPDVHEYNRDVIDALCPPFGGSVSTQKTMTRHLASGGQSNAIILATNFVGIGEDVVIKLTTNVEIQQGTFDSRFLHNDLESLQTPFRPDMRQFPRYLSVTQKRYINSGENEAFIHFNVFREIVEQYYSPCVIAPIMLSYCKLGTLLTRSHNNKIFTHRAKAKLQQWAVQKIASRYDLNQNRNIEAHLDELRDVRVRMFSMEKAETTLFDLSKVMVISPRSLLETIFMILYTLHVAQERMPGFRNNDLHANNVFMVKTASIARARFEASGPGGEGRRYFYIQSRHMYPAVADFGLSSFDGSKDIQWSEGINSTKNHYYDAAIFLTSVDELILTKPPYNRPYAEDGKFEEEEIGPNPTFQDIHDFIAEVVPRNLRHGIPNRDRDGRTIPTRFNPDDKKIPRSLRQEYNTKRSNPNILLTMMNHQVFDHLRDLRPADAQLNNPIDYGQAWSTFGATQQPRANQNVPGTPISFRSPVRSSSSSSSSTSSSYHSSSSTSSSARRRTTTPPPFRLGGSNGVGNNAMMGEFVRPAPRSPRQRSAVGRGIRSRQRRSTSTQSITRSRSPQSRSRSRSPQSRSRSRSPSIPRSRSPSRR
jgi:hypothetical protein